MARFAESTQSRRRITVCCSVSLYSLETRIWPWYFNYCTFHKISVKRVNDFTLCGFMVYNLDKLCFECHRAGKTNCQLDQGLDLL